VHWPLISAKLLIELFLVGRCSRQLAEKPASRTIDRHQSNGFHFLDERIMSNLLIDGRSVLTSRPVSGILAGLVVACFLAVWLFHGMAGRSAIPIRDDGF
jgi:hypothetical protein